MRREVTRGFKDQRFYWTHEVDSASHSKSVFEHFPVGFGVIRRVSD